MDLGPKYNQGEFGFGALVSPSLRALNPRPGRSQTVLHENDLGLCGHIF